jgi:hypothetical protein
MFVLIAIFLFKPTAFSHLFDPALRLWGRIIQS